MRGPVRLARFYRRFSTVGRQGCSTSHPRRPVVYASCPMPGSHVIGGSFMETMERATQQSPNTPEMFAQQWSHIQPQVKSWWDRLTDADLEQVAGQKERLVRTIEMRYGYARERAEQEVDRRLAEFYAAPEAWRGNRIVESASTAAKGIASTVTTT